MALTTTLKLNADLKRRIEALAKRSGKSPHAWMVEAMEREVTLSEMREQLLQDALDSADEIDAGGPLFAAEDVHAYVEARATGEPATRPEPLPRRRRGQG